jgi:ribonuclease Z
MSIHPEILGGPGRDNALYLTIDSGRSIDRLLFDCGASCVDTLKVSDIKAIDHLFFSHLHMDHVAGFDAFFRCTFDRTSKANHIWGPARTARIMQHRFRGFVWNLCGDEPAQWHAHDITQDRLDATVFALSDAFESCRDKETAARDDDIILSTPHWTISAQVMDHRTPSIAYILHEKDRVNIDTSRLDDLDLKPGPWLQQLKDPDYEAATIQVDETAFDVGQLRDQLLASTPGDSIAYLTDFIADKRACEQLAEDLSGCGTIVCEAQYRHEDLELARRHYHITARQAATIAKNAGAGRLILFHLSERYDVDGWREILADARAVFPNTSFPAHWDIP